MLWCTNPVTHKPHTRKHTAIWLLKEFSLIKDKEMKCQKRVNERRNDLIVELKCWRETESQWNAFHPLSLRLAMWEKKISFFRFLSFADDKSVCVAITHRFVYSFWSLIVFVCVQRGRQWLSWQLSRGVHLNPHVLILAPGRGGIRRGQGAGEDRGT